MPLQEKACYLRVTAQLSRDYHPWHIAYVMNLLCAAGRQARWPRSSSSSRWRGSSMRSTRLPRLAATPGSRPSQAAPHPCSTEMCSSLVDSRQSRLPPSPHAEEPMTAQGRQQPLHWSSSTGSLQGTQGPGSHTTIAMRGFQSTSQFIQEVQDTCILVSTTPTCKGSSN